MNYIGLGIALGGIGLVGIGLGYFFGKFMEGVARNPGAAKEMYRYYYVSFALIETAAIYIIAFGMLLFFTKAA